MKKVFVVGINFILFVVLQVVFAVAIYGMGYATDHAAPHNEWEILSAFLVVHSAINMLLLYMFKSIKTDFLWISYTEIAVLYGLSFWAYHG